VIENFLATLSDDFKKKLLEQTRNEVYALINDPLTVEQKNNIEFFFVQPLYYSKLYFYNAIYNQYNELSIEEILKDNSLSEEAKDFALSSLLNKLKLTSTGDTKLDANNVIHKIFYSKEDLMNNIQSVLDIEYVSFVNPSNSLFLKFRPAFERILKNEFHIPYIAENLTSDFVCHQIHDRTLSMTDLQNYYSLTQNTAFLKANMLVGLNNNDKYYTYQEQNISLADGESQDIQIVGIVKSIKIDGDNTYNVSYSQTNGFYGNIDREYTITFKGPFKGKISWEVFDKDNYPLDAIKNYSKMLECEILAPNLVDIELEILKEIPLDVFAELNTYSDKEFFENKLAQIISNKILSYNNLCLKGTANIYISPLIYKKQEFIPPKVVIPQIIASSIPEENYYFKVSKISVKETGNVYTL